MRQNDTAERNVWADRFLEHREQLLSLARKHLNPVLSKRVSAEDVVQDTLSSACGKIDFFKNNPEIPIRSKLRMLLFQTISAMERKHLQSRKRDVYKEQEVTEDSNASSARVSWNMFADTATGPATRAIRTDRCALLRKALESLPENDRRILELRHFDGMSNSDCAQILKIAPKAASIRYARALQKLQKLLIEFTEFQT